MATELALVEGLHFLKGNAMDSRTVYGFLLFGQTVAGGQITSSSVLSALQEETGTGYARVVVVLGADTNGIQIVPSWALNPGAATDWHSTASAVGIASASSGGVGIYVWDLGGGSYDMSKANNNLAIPSVNFFVENPGGI
jgi:hypothetical protein